MQDFFYWVKASIINIEYRTSKKKPLNLPITSFFGSNAIINIKTAKTNIHIISRLKISVSSNMIRLPAIFTSLVSLTSCPGLMK